MCRLMGYVAGGATTLADIAGPNFTQFTDLSQKHGDGWGIATADGSKSPTLLIEPSRARESEKFADAAKNLQSNAALLHLRWATLGLAVSEGNTHPFVQGDISFIHNGGIMPPASLDPMIAPEFIGKARGDTDSERYFYVLLSEIAKSNLTDGVLSGVRKIRDNCKFSSINAMLLTPTKLIIICEHNNDRIPDDETDDYYELYYRKDEKGVLVASSGWDQANWKELPNHNVLIVDRESQEMEIIAL